MFDPATPDGGRQGNSKTAIISDFRQVVAAAMGPLPSLIVNAGDRARVKFVEFFTAQIRNRHTRKSYAIAVRSFFAWCEERGLLLTGLSPVIIAAYVEELGHRMAPPSVK